MEVVAFVISLLSLAIAGGGLAWNMSRWRAERRSDVRVLAWHDGMGVDIYSADWIEGEQVVAARVFNYGERPEHVMRTGLQSLNGEPLANDLPKAEKIVDDQPPEAREVPPRGQLATQFKLPGQSIADGFVGYADLGTGERIYSVPASSDPALREMQEEILKGITSVGPDGEGDEEHRRP